MRHTPTLAGMVANHAAKKPDETAIICADTKLSWSDYHILSTRLAGVLLASDLSGGDTVAVLLPDGLALHVSLLALEKAGLVAMGIGPRAGRLEIEHLLRVSGSSALISFDMHMEMHTSKLVDDLRESGLPLNSHFCLAEGFDHFKLRLNDEPVVVPPATPELAATIATRSMSGSELYFLNSTSGTTGMPKCVAHTQQRWIEYHKLVMQSAPLTEADIFLSAIPGIFGFGLWTSRFTPTILGCATVILPKFSADALIRALARHRVTVMAAVSTQFIMMLNSPLRDELDLSSLRILYTGGEAVPYERAAEFESLTGAYVLQFYGSNETGALSFTSVADTREKRLTTAGRLIPGMNVRLVNDSGEDVTALGIGQPACKGAVNSLGYFNNEEAQQQLFTPDGWMLTGDIASLDADGYLTITGRVADFIIRGGKNISGPAVEQAVAKHPSVDLAAAVGMPDPVFGERVCVYVELKDDATLELMELVEFMQHAGYSREYFPEHLVVMDELPIASGGKVAKHILREDIRRRVV